MSNNTEDRRSAEKKNNLQNLRQTWAKNDIEMSAERSRKKLERLIDEEHFEENLKHEAKIREKEREELRSRKKGKKSSSVDVGQGGDAAVYQAKASLGKKKGTKRRRENFINRTVRLGKELSAAGKTLKTDPTSPTSRKSAFTGK